MTASEYFTLLNNPDDLDSQIKFCEALVLNWRKNDDPKMANMYQEIALNLRMLQKHISNSKN
jgi:hypothetical protein